MIEDITRKVKARNLPLTVYYLEDTRVSSLLFDKEQVHDEEWTPTDAEAEEALKQTFFADPVLFVTRSDMSESFCEKETFLSRPIVTSIISLLSLISALAFSLGPWSLNPTVMNQLLTDETITPDYLNHLIWPTLAPVLIIQAAHEAAQYGVAKSYGIKTSTPTLIPSITTGLFPSVTRIESPPPSRKALFDYGIAGPAAGIVVSMVFLLLGLAITHAGGSGVGELPRLPAGVIMQSGLAGGVINFGMGDVLLGMEVSL